MASQQQNELSQKVEEITGQAPQLLKDDYSNQATSHAIDGSIHNSPSDQNSSITSQATNFLQQTGVQVKSMAQGAANAVKHTLGMADNNNNNNSNNNLNTDLKNINNSASPSMPGYPSTRI